MNIDTTKLYTLIIVVALFFIGFGVVKHFNDQKMADERKIRQEKIKTVQFKGKVVGFEIYRYLKRNYYKVCVKLDSSSTQSLFVCNDLDCIQIKDGIATFSAGYLNPLSGVADSVAVNIHNSDKIMYYYKTGTQNFVGLGFNPMGIKEDDLKGCN